MEYSDLDNLFKDPNPSKCKGCSVLGKPRMQHGYDDYSAHGEVSVLFVSDCLKYFNGDFHPFRNNEYALIKKILKDSGFSGSVGFTSAIKCPNIKDGDMTPADRKICRAHLYDTLAHYRPKLVITCGKQANTMLMGSNKAEEKSRGRMIDFSVNNLDFKVVNIYHPYQAIVEPAKLNLMMADIINAIDSGFPQYKKPDDPDIPKFRYTVVLDTKTLTSLEFDFESGEDPISVDIETTGLNFLTDKILTVAITGFKDGVFHTIAMPIDHTSVSDPRFRSNAMEFIKNCMRNPKNRKILQNCKFDLKFFYREGITKFFNIWDTKILQHLLDENIPKSLRDLVYYYYPKELEHAYS